MGKRSDAIRTDDSTTPALPHSTTTTSTTGPGNKMKVTVCFGNVRVIVPCSNQDMLVRDLIHQATLRYKKAAGKGQDSWVVVHKLKSQSDGGILDLDDKLTDVADDREQIMAIYEEDHDGMPSLQHNAGDGTSASSVGTNSPDIFQGTEHKFQPFARTDIEITGEELGMNGASGANSNGSLSLQVRRGSEPALNRLSPVHLSPPDPSKRWSAAPVIDEDKNGLDTDEKTADATSNCVTSSVSSSVTTVYCNDTNKGQRSENSDSNKNTSEPYTKFLRNKSTGNVSSHASGPSRFSRDNHRLSMQFFADGSSKWADAADRALCLSLRKEPVGANASPNYDSSDSEQFKSATTDNVSTTEVILMHEAGPLGIHLVPEHNENGRNQGLVVQSVEKGGRIDKNGCLKSQDKIVEINSHSLIGVPFQAAQELFRQGLNAEQLRLKVIKKQVDNPLDLRIGSLEGEEKENMVHSEEKIVGNTKLATVSSTKKSPLQPLPVATTSLITSNTRKIGRKYEVDLQKGPQGLGFSITTRDNPAGGNCPIYIKNILPHGAAIDDGRLRPGDRLLEVNGIEITGKTQAEAVSILKNIPLGGIVKMVVSRQERVDLSPKLPRQIPPEKVEEDTQPEPWTEREMLVFDIPVLDTEKAGLGISVKGKTAAQMEKGMVDMGIFIKSVIHGGAASRDGRLKPNDQLLSVNGISLLNCSNTFAMETLRKTMTQDGPKPKPGFITLKVARRVPTSSAPTTDISGCGSSASGDEMDSWGSKNVSMSVDGSHNEDSKHKERSETSSSPSRQTPQRFSSPSRNNEIHCIPTSGPIAELANVINSSRSSSLRRVDMLKGKFENQTPNHIDRPPLDLPRNPVLDRLTGKNIQTSRSDSYYKATGDINANEGIRPSYDAPCTIPNNHGTPRRQSGVILQSPNGEMVILEDDSAPRKPPRRSRSTTPEHTLDQRPKYPMPQELPSPSIVSNDQPPLSDATYASQTSLEDSGGFSRDAFGRQSMSEKRHATLDAKNTDTYQRNKKLREERERKRQDENQRKRQDQNLYARRGTKRPLLSPAEDDADVDSRTKLSVAETETSLSPPHWGTLVNSSGFLKKGRRGDRLGLGDQLLQLLHHWGQKRSSHRSEAYGLPRVNSADSLVDSLKNCTAASTDGRKGAGKGVKKDIGPSLGMKKSSSLESLQTMVQEIVVEEDMKSGYVPPRSGPQTVKVIRGRGCNESFRQAVDRSYDAPLSGIEHQMETLAEEESESCLSGPVTTRNVKFEPDSHVDDRSRSSKKKQGLFKGLGSMFRFGRHRKNTSRGTNEWENQDKVTAYGSNIDPVQEQFRRLAEKRRDEKDAKNSAPYISVSNDYADERQLHVSRVNAHYSNGTGSMRSKKPSRKSLDTIVNTDVNGNPSGHARSSSYDVYNEMTRPGSRVGFADPKKYSHYINYDEIKQHLNDPSSGRSIRSGLPDAVLRQMRNTVVEQRKKAILESRRHQQHYHSQRREHPRERQDRPVSNFYEYESVQAALHAQNSQNPIASSVLNSGTQPYRNCSTVAIQQQNNRNNNNGVTLPSPTVMSTGFRQLSPSQFQAVPPTFSQSHNHHSRSASNDNERGRSADHFQRRQQHLQNSLPRRQKMDPANYTQRAPFHPQSPLRHTLQPHQYPVSRSHQQASQSNIHQQSNHYHRQQVSQPQSSSSGSVSQMHHHVNNVIYPPGNVSVGSKV